MNHAAYSRVRRWTASFALVGYGFVALAGHGMHAITPCDHALHAAHPGDEVADDQLSVAEARFESDAVPRKQAAAKGDAGPRSAFANLQ